MNVEVSVIMPVYNSARFVSAALESVLGQSLRDIEVVAIDDGSTDGSGEMLDQMARGDGRVRVVHRENRGIVATLNEGLEMARGKYIARMDSDDVAMPERFARQVAFFNEHPEHVCVGGLVLLMDAAGRPLQVLRPPMEHEEIDRAHMGGHTSIVHPAAMMRAETVRRVGGYSPGIRFAQDLDLWLRLAEVGKLANIPSVVLKYRVHADSITSRHAEEQLNCMRQSCDLARARRGIAGQVEIARHWRAEGEKQKAEAMLNFGWLAFSHGYRWTALVYGVKSVAARPAGVRGWKLLGCAAIKRMPPVEGLGVRG